VAAKPKRAAPKPEAIPEAKLEAKPEAKPNPWSSGAYKKL
jgi:hypothetical protein